jgi:hypothetical protein
VLWKNQNDHNILFCSFSWMSEEKTCREWERELKICWCICRPSRIYFTSLPFVEISCSSIIVDAHCLCMSVCVVDPVVDLQVASSRFKSLQVASSRFKSLQVASSRFLPFIHLSRYLGWSKWERFRYNTPFVLLIKIPSCCNLFLVWHRISCLNNTHQYNPHHDQHTRKH